MTAATPGHIRTVLGDRTAVPDGVVYGHEHLIIDSPLVADRFPHIHLYDVEAATAEVSACRAAGAVLMIDAMPVCDGRDAVRLAEISRRTGVDIVAATGLHHDRYYGPLHWTNRVGVDDLASLFVADLLDGIDEFDYTGPIVRRTPYRAGILKVATSGHTPDQRDRRNLDAVAESHRLTGAPILTHCEQGAGGAGQIEHLAEQGVHPSAVILSHVDKARDLGYLIDLASSGAILELDQGLREREGGPQSITVRAIVALITEGYGGQVIVGTDGARRSLWSSLGGEPGLAWLARELPPLLRQAGLGPRDVRHVLHDNAVGALRWRPVPLFPSDRAARNTRLAVNNQARAVVVPKAPGLISNASASMAMTAQPPEKALLVKVLLVKALLAKAPLVKAERSSSWLTRRGPNVPG